MSVMDARYWELRMSPATTLAALAAAIRRRGNAFLDRITIETNDGDYFRWRCSCNRFGAWLEQERSARRNGEIHRRLHQEAA